MQFFFVVAEKERVLFDPTLVQVSLPSQLLVFSLPFFLLHCSREIIRGALFSKISPRLFLTSRKFSSTVVGTSIINMAMDAKGERKLIIKMESSPLSPFSPKEENRGKRPALQQLTNMQPLTSVSSSNHERNNNALMKSPTISLTSSPFATETPPSRGFDNGAVIVEFPPGPMGLVLEPVILSSEREIGCKVKDYYFGVDHQGIDAEKLQDLVEIGDVVTFIGSKNVQSARFTDILDLLRSLKDAKRVITFKNMSISCT